MQLATKIGAILLIFFGVIIVAGTLIKITDGSSKYPLVTDLLMMSLLGVGPLVLGIWMLNRQNKQQKLQQTSQQQRLVLSLAARLGGKISALDISQHTTIPLQKANSILEELHHLGQAEILISQKGEVLYEIKGLNLSEEERKNAERL